MSIKEKINFKLYFTLLGAAVFGITAVMPYLLIVQKSVIEKSGVALGVFIPVAILQSAVYNALVLFFALLMIHRTGFKIPYISAFINKENTPERFRSIIPLSITSGIIVGILIIAADLLFKKGGIMIKGGIPEIAWWKGFLASFYGGIVEEILMRLFLMTFIVWIIMKLRKLPEGSPGAIPVWAGIIGATLIFGAGHLPTVAALTEVTTGLVIRTLVLNGIGGIVFGWLFWKKGLESAIIAHFSTDIVIHVLAPLAAKAAT